MSSSRLAAPFVTATVIALAACSSSPGGGGGGTGGGQTGSGGTSGSGGAGVDAPPDIAREVPPRDICAGFILNQTRPRDVSLADFCATFTTRGPYGLPGAAAAAFCTKYGAICKFGGAGGYADQTDCLARYGAVSAGVKGCRASGVCDAAITALQPGVPDSLIRQLCTRATANSDTCS